MARALYKMTYWDKTTAFGVVYIGDDGVAGMDAGGGAISGSISKSAHGVNGTVFLQVTAGQTLVTGQPVTQSGPVSFTINGPANYLNGQALQVTIGGSSLQVKFDKIADIPITGGTNYADPMQSGSHPALSV